MTPPGDNPNAPSPDHEQWPELISAYLDNELPPAERAEVDRLLADNAEARRLLQELSALSAAIHEVPPERAPRGLADAVLQAAEQRRQAPASTLSTDDDGGRGPRLSLGRSPRGWAWAVMAIAAALVVMILQPEQQPELVKSDSAAAPPAAVEPAPSMSAREPAAEPSAAEAEVFDGAEDESLAVESLADAARSAPALDLPASGEPGSRSSEQPTPPPPAAPIITTAPSFAGGGTGESDGRAALGGVETSGLVVVRVAMRPEAFHNRLVETVLGGNYIDVLPTTVALSDEEPPTAGRSSRSGSAADAGVSGGAGPTDAFGSTTSSEGDPDQPTDDLQLMLVQAPRTQLAGALGDLSRDYFNVFDLDVRPAFRAPAKPTYNFLQEEVAREQQVASELRAFSRSAIGPQQAANAPAAPPQQLSQRKAAGNERAATKKGAARGSRGVAVRLTPTVWKQADEQQIIDRVHRLSSLRSERPDAWQADRHSGQQGEFQPMLMFVNPREAAAPAGPPSGQ